MKEYDFDKAKEIIEQHKNEIVTAEMGMHEDWFWTATVIWEKGKYSKVFALEEKELAGISGSTWATPVISLEFKDGKQKMIPCFKGKSSAEKPSSFSLGCLSGPCQDAIPEIDK